MYYITVAMVTVYLCIAFNQVKLGPLVNLQITSFQFLRRLSFHLSSSSDFERYYYYNSATDRASWDYPTTDASTDQPQEKSNTVLSTTTSVTSQESCASAPTTPPPGVILAATPSPVEEEWQGPPPPPPPLEEGEIPPSPPTPPTLEEPDVNEEDGGCDAEESYQVESGPQLYYGPQAPPPEVPAAEEVCVFA